jgi:hypothetical protein
MDLSCAVLEPQATVIIVQTITTADYSASSDALNHEFLRPIGGSMHRLFVFLVFSFASSVIAQPTII